MSKSGRYGNQDKIRNRKKKEKFDGFDPALQPKHKPYKRIHKKWERTDELS